MLAELAGSGERVETVQSGEARKQAQISSVGAAFGSFNHDNLIKPKTKEDSESNETQVEQKDQNVHDEVDQTDLPQLERIDSNAIQDNAENVADRPGLIILLFRKTCFSDNF